MKPRFNKSTSPKIIGRIKKKIRIRRKVFGTLERPRLCVFRSTNHMYAQLIDDVSGKTLLAASSLKGVDSKQPGIEVAKSVGALIAKLASEKDIQSVVFDRSGFIYHGRIKALAEAAREAGLKF